MLKLPLPRRRPSYYRQPYYKKPRRYPKISLLSLALAIPVLVIVLELLARVFVGIGGKNAELGPSLVNKAYRLNYLTETKKPIEGLSDGGNLVVLRSPSFGYQLLENQKSQFLQINPQGFRDQDPLPLAKPKNEIRIFVLGGSAAFGYGSKNNQATIAHQLETRLRQRVEQQKLTPDTYRPDVFPFFVPTREKLMQLPPKIHPGQYRVINAAVPGYTSGNSLAQFALKILPYQPDMIVILDGYSDLMLPSNQAKADVPKVDDFLQDASAHYKTYLSQSFQHLINQTYLVKALDKFVLKPQPTLAQATLVIPSDTNSLTQYLPNNDKELKLRVQRYQENHKQLIRLAATAGIPVVIASQPEITGLPVGKLSPQEKMMRDQLGKNYLEKIPKAYAKFIQADQQLVASFPKNVKVVNLYGLPKKSSNPMFSDPIHLTDSANTVVAEKLYHTITSWEKIQIIPENYYLK